MHCFYFTTKYSPMKWQCLTVPKFFSSLNICEEGIIFFYFMKRDSRTVLLQLAGRYRIIQTLVKTNLVLTFFSRNTSLTTSVWKRFHLFLFWFYYLWCPWTTHWKKRQLRLWVKAKLSVGSHEWKKRSYRNES